MSAKRVPLYPPSGKAKKSTGAFHQAYKNLQFFWIMKAGHMVSVVSFFFHVRFIINFTNI